MVGKTHYETQDRERFPVQELGLQVSFARLTRNNVPDAEGFLV